MWSGAQGREGRSNVKVADCSLSRHSRRRIGMAEEPGGPSGPGHQGQRREGRTAPSEEASHRAGSAPGSEFVPVHLPPAVKVSLNSAPPAVIEFVPAKSVRRRRLWVLGCLLGGIGIGATGVLLLPGGREAVKLPPLPPVLNQPVLGLPTGQARGSAQTPARVGPAASPDPSRIGRMMTPLAVPTPPDPSQSPGPRGTPRPGPSPTATPEPTPTPTRRHRRPPP